MAHPALQDLYGATYFDEPFVNGVSRSFATYNPHAGRRWSVKNYIKICAGGRRICRKTCARPGSITASSRTLVIAVTPEGRAVLPGVSAVDRRDAAARRRSTATDESREQAAARYLAFRIDRDTMAGGRPAFGLVERIDAVGSLLAASICPISNMACAPITTICAMCCRSLELETAPDEKRSAVAQCATELQQS